MARTVTRIDTRQIVYSRNHANQLIGPHVPDGSEIFTPWKWNDRIWTSLDYENSDLTLQVLGDPSKVGLPDSYWQSGVGSLDLDLKVNKFKKIYKNGLEKWTFEMRHGTYFKYDQERYLFSDRSVVQHIDDADNVSGRNVLQLTFTPRLGTPIKATIWKRDSNNVPHVYRTIQKRVNFSGSYTADGELPTVDGDGNIIWDNIDESRHEFIVNWNTDPPKLYFNDDFTFLIGKDIINEDDDLEYCEYLGEGNGTENQAFLTKYFPICDDETEITLYVTNYTTTKTLDTDYVLDLDRGEITFVDADNSALWTPAAGDHLYLRYRVVPEIEYEPEYATNFCTAPVVNLNPINSFADRGFIYLTEQELRVAYLELETDATVIDAENYIYGPLYLGTDFCILKATAYNMFDQPVPGVTVSFTIREAESGDGGRLNGSVTTASAITDGNGVARLVYTAPRSIESVGQYVEHPVGDDDNKLELIYTDGIQDSTLDQLFIYQVYSTDGFDDGNSSNTVSGLQTWYEYLTEDGEPGHGGRKVVLYAWDDAVIHPITHGTGAYTPVRPNSLEGDWLIFKDSEGGDLNLPHTETGANKLVAYWISGGKRVGVYAECYSYFYNNTVYSNDIEFRLEIPQYLQGTYVSSELGGEIPYGFRLYDEYGSVASGIDGATFICINPMDGNLPVLWDGSATGEIVNANPFTDGNILGHEFTVPRSEEV